MKKIFIVLFFLVGVFFFSFQKVEAKSYSSYRYTPSYSSYRVNSYYKSSGTYVPSYYRTRPNSYKWDNYSAKANYNPYTGKKGYTKW